MTSTHSRRLLAAAAIGLLVLAPVAPAMAASQTNPLQEGLDRLTKEDKAPGALAYVTEADGTSITVVSGTAERGTGRPMVGADAKFRIGSITKPVVAVTVLRLVEQHKIALDAPVERYLPGVLRGTGAGAAIDGRKITVRSLLQQTSGLPDFMEAVDWSKPSQDVLKIALGLKPTPGGRFAYANTNYLVAGMVVKAVTGRDFREVSRDLVLEPLGMRGTYWPAKGDTGLRKPYAHTYGVNPADPQGGVTDMTRLPGYELGASGGLVSTPQDLNRFWDGVFTGKALSDRAFLKRTVPMQSGAWPAGSRYGFGMARVQTSCGTVWFHGGDVPGVFALSGRAASGRQATVYTTGSMNGDKQFPHLIATLTTALCP